METATEQLQGKELLRAAVNQILKHPETWDQEQWHCGSTHCIGGWCQILGGRAELIRGVLRDTQELVGLTEEQTEYLVSGERLLIEIHGFASRFIAGQDPLGVTELLPL